MSVLIAPVPMSNYITPSYTFAPGPSGIGTVNLSGIDNFDIKRLVAIINQTAGIIIYSSGNSSCNYTAVSGTTITLKTDTSEHRPNDVLQVVYDTGYTRLDPVFPINIENCYVSNEVEIKNDEGNPVPVSANQSGAWNINNISGTVSLPTGAATLDAQNTGNASLSSIDDKTPSLGQTLMAGSVPVTLASNQPAIAVTGPLTDDQLRASAVSVTGPLTDNQLRASAVSVTGPLTDTQLRAAAVPVSGAVTATQSGTWNINNVSGTVSLPTGAATSANQDLANSFLTSLDSKTPSLLNGRQPSEILGMPGVARQLSAGPTSVNTALTTGVTRVSIYANGGSIRYSVGSSPQTASNTSHFIAMGERLDIMVPATAHIAVIRANATNCTLEVTELI